MSFSCSSFHLSVLRWRGYSEWSSWPSAWDPRFLLPFLWVPLTIFQGLTAFLVGQPGSFALPAEMGRGAEIALLSQSTLTHRLHVTVFLSPGLEEPSSGQSHNLLTIKINCNHERITLFERWRKSSLGAKRVKIASKYLPDHDWSVHYFYCSIYLYIYIYLSIRYFVHVCI